MSLTVQSIANDSNFDVRQAIGTGAGTPIQVYAGLIDRIHKDCMHSSVYEWINRGFVAITTVPGQSFYEFNFLPGLRRILSVYDRTRDRLLFPIERATSPVSQVDNQELSPGQQGSAQTKYGPSNISALSLQSGQPEYFKLTLGGISATYRINLYPTPRQVLTLNITGEAQVATLVNPTDILLVPEDGRDMVVAGVNYLVNLLVKRMDEAQTWAQIYERLKRGESLV